MNTDLRGLPSLGRSDRSLGSAPGRGEDGRAHAVRVALTAEDMAYSYVFLASTRARVITGTAVHPGAGTGVAVRS